MTEMRPGGQPRPFTPAELDGASGLHADEVASNVPVARELERLAAGTTMAPSPGFADRVMQAVAAEPAPSPARLAGLALRRLSVSAFLLSLRDAWRVTTSAGFPVAARAQAMALVLVVAAMATGSGMVTAGALGLLDGDHSSPSPSIEQPAESAEPSADASDTAEPSEDASTSPDASPDPSESAGDESAEPDASTEPSETPDDHSGSGSGSDSGSTPKPTSTPSPSSSDHEDHTESPSATPRPSQTPGPSETPRPSESPGDH